MKLSKFVVFAAATESKLAEQWAAIEKRVRGSARRPLTGVVIGSIALAAAAAFVFVLQRPGGASIALEGGVLGHDTGLAAVDLGEGSHVEVEPRARLAVLPGDLGTVRVEVRSGTARFEVSHVDGRSFVVRAAGLEIGVVGARFRVSVDGESRSARIVVEQGAVEVRRRGAGEAVRRIGAGEEGMFGADPAVPVISDAPVVRETPAER